jgi:hypothetical protein
MPTQSTSIAPQTLRTVSWRFENENLILAAFAALSLTAAVAPAVHAASTVDGDRVATRMQQTGSYG